MSELLAQRLTEIDELQSREGWHRDGEMLPTLYALVGSNLDVVEYPVHEGLWKLPLRPGQHLKFLATLLRYARSKTADGETTIRGFVFATEAWMVTAGREGEDELMEFARERRISEHPERVEIRLTTGVLADGSENTLSHARGQEATFLGEGADGEVLAGLRAVVEALKDEDR